MARPKKLSDADALRLVDSLYEQCGDCSRLKFSELEKHAVSLNIDVKAYDLRRNATVLRRIAEIKTLELDAGSLDAVAYKGLDIDGFISSNKTPDKLKRSLSELDGRWRKLYEYAAATSKRESALSDELRKAETFTDELKSRNAALIGQMDERSRQISGLKAEKTYLRKTIREYLYPALADSILKSETISFGANQTAIDTLTDGDVPASFRESIAADRALQSREDILLENLRLQILEDD